MSGITDCKNEVAGPRSKKRMLIPKIKHHSDHPLDISME